MPESSIADLELASQMEKSHATVLHALQPLLEEAKTRNPHYYLTYFFARYDAQLRQLQDWAPILDLLWDPALMRNSRYTLIDRVDWIFMTMKGLSPALRDSYLLALLRAALAYSEASDQASLLGTYVKFWIQGEVKPDPKVEKVFELKPDVRLRALEMLRRLPATADLKFVESWLRR